MAKYALIIGLLSLSFQANSQNLEQQISLQQLQDIQGIDFSGSGSLFNAQRFQLDADYLQLEIPNQYIGEDRNRIRSLFSELRQICPDCSTGGTIGGAVITGGNSVGNGTPLFPIEAGNGGGLIPTVTITRSEYNSLKQKAALYDSIVSNTGEDQ